MERDIVQLLVGRHHQPPLPDMFHHRAQQLIIKLCKRALNALQQQRQVTLKQRAGVTDCTELKMSLLQRGLHIACRAVQIDQRQRVAGDDKGEQVVVDGKVLDQGSVFAEIALQRRQIERLAVECGAVAALLKLAQDRLDGGFVAARTLVQCVDAIEAALLGGAAGPVDLAVEPVQLAA